MRYQNIKLHQNYKLHQYLCQKKKRNFSTQEHLTTNLKLRRQYYLISTRVLSISTGLWKCITYFDQAVCLLHFSHNMATISSNIKTSCLPHVFAIYLFLSLHLLTKDVFTSLKLLHFFYSNLQELKKEPCKSCGLKLNASA